jgi:hypothetical protein
MYHDIPFGISCPLIDTKNGYFSNGSSLKESLFPYNAPLGETGEFSFWNFFLVHGGFFYLTFQSSWIHMHNVFDLYHKFISFFFSEII